jgi:tRNA pseudouridine55 synthase
MDGFIVIDKPSGMTSHDVVNVVRRITGIKKVGHTGTLDPFATGVLPVAMGEATKAIPYLDEVEKEYSATLRLGESTDTQDFTGRIIERKEWRGITPESIQDVFSRFRGRQSQLPPKYSALKHNGVPLYRLARRGEEVCKKPRCIEIFSLAIDSVSLPEVEFTVRCSRGTYIRTLSHDMGEELGCGAHLAKLRRTASGPFTLNIARSLDAVAILARDGLLGNIVISPYEALSHLSDFQVDEAVEMKVSHGIAPRMNDFISLSGAIEGNAMVRISSCGRLSAVAQVLDNGGERQLRLVRVFN